MNSTPIRAGLFPVREALKSLDDHASEIEGLIVMVANKDGDYTYFVAGTVSVETSIGRLEVMKRALLEKIK